MVGVYSHHDSYSVCKSSMEWYPEFHRLPVLLEKSFESKTKEWEWTVLTKGVKRGKV